MVDLLSSYGRYKESTRKFLCWLSEASRGGEKKIVVGKKGIEGSLRDISAAVESLVLKDFITLSPTLQGSFQDLLGHCREAIHLREVVSSKYDASSPGYAGHVNFIACLKEWLSSLQRWGPCKIDEKEDQSISYTVNLFDHLDLDDDDDDEDTGDDKVNVDEYKLLFKEKGEIEAQDKLDREQLELMFEEDLTLQLFLFLKDIEDISEQVSIAWLGVKNESQSIFTAAVTTSAAISAVRRICNSLMLNFPSIQDYPELHTVMREYLPQKVYEVHFFLLFIHLFSF